MISELQLIYNALLKLGSIPRWNSSSVIWNLQFLDVISNCWLIILNFTVLITRLTKQRYLEIGDHWTEDQHVSRFSTIRFEYRVTCDPHYYGKGCENLCRPRDDNFGHYSCSPLGERICHAGWTGDYCSKRKLTILFILSFNKLNNTEFSLIRSAKFAQTIET